MSARFFRIVAGVLLATTSVAVVAVRNPKWWADNLGGPESANYVDLDQIKKANVQQLDVACVIRTSSGFNPIVVDDVIYGGTQRLADRARRGDR
jgi:glucose dehydrogenase